MPLQQRFPKTLFVLFELFVVVIAVLRVPLRSAPSYPPASAFWLWRPPTTPSTMSTPPSWLATQAVANPAHSPIRPFAQDDDALLQMLVEFAVPTAACFTTTPSTPDVSI